MKKLRLESLRKSFGKQVILADFSLVISKGKITALTGESGSGKTTALRIIAGLEKPDSGQVFIGDREVTKLPPNKRKIGFVFQNLALFPHMTVGQNIGFAIQKGSREKKDRINELLSLTSLVGLEARYPHELSGGQQQRVALARALATEPEVLLLDEPFSNLDEALKSKVRFEIKEIIRKLEITTVLVTHHPTDAFMIADEVVMIKDGEILQKGTPAEIYQQPKSQYISDFFGASVILEGTSIPRGIRTPFGDLNLNAGNRDTPINVFIRPENISFVDQPMANLSGIVIGKIFKGPHELLTIQDETEKHQFNLETEHSNVEVGDPVFLKAKEEDILLF